MTSKEEGGVIASLANAFAFEFPDMSACDGTQRNSAISRDLAIVFSERFRSWSCSIPTSSERSKNH